MTRKWQKQAMKAGRMVSEFRLLTNKENKKNKKGFARNKMIVER